MERAAVYMINGSDIQKWFYLGAQEVQSNKKYLNSINVFPVADGDTGTNLSTTLKAMVEFPETNTNFNSMMKNMSESALAHARGNSGILFASYVNGMAIEGSKFDVISIPDFAKIAKQAVDYLYHAVENPLEGTMISVIKDWATFLFQNKELYDNFQELLMAAYQVATTSLEKTATQLEVLRRSHVVDSGAEGFVKFLSGINRYFHGGEIVISKPVEKAQLNLEDEYTGAFGYCTEVFMNLNSASKSIPETVLDQTIRKLLHQDGDSFILSRTGDSIRIHIHTDIPEVVIDKVRAFGSFIEQKVDFMRLQQAVISHPVSKIGIITDSIADIPEDYKLENQVHTLPLGLLIDDEVYLDKLTIKLPQLFKRLPSLSTYPTSSQAEPGRIHTFLENLSAQYDSLIFVSVASKLSGTYQALQQEAKKMNLAGKKITIVDSKLNSGAQGLLVQEAVTLLKSGLSHDDIVTQLEKSLEKTNIYVCLNTLEFAIRSGRVPNTIGKLGMFFGMRPIMTLDKDGNGAAFGVGFSKKSITKKIYSLINSKLKTSNIEDYCIVHCDNLPLAQEYEKELTKLIGKKPSYITEISSIIAIHSGLGCVAVCTKTK